MTGSGGRNTLPGDSVRFASLRPSHQGLRARFAGSSQAGPFHYPCAWMHRPPGGCFFLRTSECERTKEALARKKAEGKHLGRTKGAVLWKCLKINRKRKSSNISEEDFCYAL